MFFCSFRTGDRKSNNAFLKCVVEHCGRVEGQHPALHNPHACRGLWLRPSFFYRWSVPLQASVGNQAGHEGRRHAVQVPHACGGGLPSFIAGMLPCRPAWATKLATKSDAMHLRVLAPVAEAFLLLSLGCSLAGQRGQPSWTRRASPCIEGSSRLYLASETNRTGRYCGLNLDGIFALRKRTALGVTAV